LSCLKSSRENAFASVFSLIQMEVAVKRFHRIMGGLSILTGKYYTASRRRQTGAGKTA
jgi:hypothetical protein